MKVFAPALDVEISETSESRFVFMFIFQRTTGRRASGGFIRVSDYLRMEATLVGASFFSGNLFSFITCACRLLISSSIYQIPKPNTEHIAYRLVRTLVTRSFSSRRAASSQRACVPLHAWSSGWPGGGGRQRRSLGPCVRDGQGGGVRGRRAVDGRRLPAVQH